MYVERLVLNEFRAIAGSDIQFTHPVSPGADRRVLPNINLLVGTNGGGKSTILKAIAAAALGGQVDLDDLTGGSILSWPRIGGSGSCYARVTYRGEPAASGPDQAPRIAEESIRIESGAVTHSSQDEAVAAPLQMRLFGYGPLRLADSDLASQGASDPEGWVANLFEREPHLSAPESWVPELGEEALEAVNALMPPDTRLTGGMHDGRVEVENRGLNVGRDMLSDGAQSYMAWVLDLVSRLIEAGDSEIFTDIRATALVDEIDQRMHPRWQQVVLQQLADGLPNVQFICTAHSPLLAGGLRPVNLTVLEPDHDASGDGAMKASQLEEDVFGRTADGVLTSSYFNLVSSRPEQFRQDLRILAEQASSMDEAAIDFIRKLAGTDEGDIHVRSEIVERPDRLRHRRQ